MRYVECEWEEIWVRSLGIIMFVWLAGKELKREKHE